MLVFKVFLAYDHEEKYLYYLLTFDKCLLSLQEGTVEI